jgi:Glyoxalase-like domain
MARFWDDAMDWTLHEVTDDHAVWRSAKGVGPYLEFLRTGVKTVPDRVHLELVPDPGFDERARQLSAGGPDWAARSRPPPRNDSTNAGLVASSAGVPSIRSSPPPMT